MKQTYQAPGEETAGIRNLVLIYNGYYEQNRGNWTLEEFLPYLHPRYGFHGSFIR